jgi:calcium-dependent protein kinase
MSNVQEMRIFAAEQIDVPDEFPGILKNFIKEVVRAQPDELVKFSTDYFGELMKQKANYTNPADREQVLMGPKEFYLKHKFSIKDHYDLHETIGEGALSRVRRATHKQSNNIRAVKVVRKEDLEFGERRKVLEEIELLKELDHPNIG